MRAYKLMRKMKDGYAPLFINKRQRLQVGVPYAAENHPTNGFKQRSGWHCTLTPNAPHLRSDEGSGRVWVVVELDGQIDMYDRPESQGGTWVLCHGSMTIEEELPHDLIPWINANINRNTL